MVDSRPGSSTKLFWFFRKPKGPLFRSELLFLSMDRRRLLGRSVRPGSKERLRRLNCCILPRFLGDESTYSTMVGAVVMMAGAGAGYVSVGVWGTPGRDLLPAAGGRSGTGGASAAACSFALTDSCESEAWRKRIRLNRRVKGVLCCTGGEAGRSPPSWADHDRRGTSLETARRLRSAAAASSSGSCSADLFRRALSPRLKRPAGSRVLRRRRSFSLRPGRSRVGIALAGLAAHLRRSRGEASSSAAHGTVVGGWRVGVGGKRGGRGWRSG